MVGLVSARGTVLATRDRVPLPQTLIQQVVVPETYSREALLQRGIADPRSDRYVARLAAKVADEEGDVLQRRGRGVYAAGLAVAEVLVEAAAVRIDGCRRPAQIAEQCQPGPALRLGSNQRVV